MQVAYLGGDPRSKSERSQEGGSHGQGSVTEDPAVRGSSVLLRCPRASRSFSEPSVLTQRTRWFIPWLPPPPEGACPWRPSLPSLPTLAGCVCSVPTGPAHRESTTCQVAPAGTTGGRSGPQWLAHGTGDTSPEDAQKHLGTPGLGSCPGG